MAASDATPRCPLLVAVVLAAGFGRRIGGPKARLRLPDGTPFLGAVLASVRAARPDAVVAVLGPWWDGTPEVPEDTRAVVNPDPDRGQISSVRCAIEAVKDLGRAALLLAPVDHPRVSPVTFAAVAEAHRASPDRIVVVTHRGRRGHPVLFPAALVPELLGPVAAAGGARAVVRTHPDLVEELPVDDPAVLEDVDTKDDYGLLRS